MNAITTIPDESRMIDIMRESVFPGASPDSVRMVLAYCQARGLDPLRKPVHIVPMWVKAGGGKSGAMQDVVMPGIALYRIEAARTGEYAGKSEPVFGPTITADLGGLQVRYPEWCSITVFRMVAGEARAFPAREYWLENYATAGRDSERPNTMWAKRAFGQIAKCAEAQALRMAFPEATGGEPTAEEMEGKTEPRFVQNTATEEARPPGDLRTYAQTLAKPVDATWPLLNSAGILLPPFTPEQWPHAVQRVLAKLEDAIAVRAWRAGMGPHFASISETDAAAVTAAEAAIEARLASFDVPYEREPGEEG